MAYEIYKQQVGIEDYFKRWDDERLEGLNDLMRGEIYAKYLVKCEVFQRDKFNCQDVNCEHEEAKLTMHHIKWQKNGGTNKARNCVTLCETCHKRYHAGKQALVMKNVKALPTHIRGHTFKLDKLNEINWKIIKKEMKRFRKTIHDESGLNISWEQVAILMRWLEMVYDED